MKGMTKVILEKGDFMRKQLTVALGLAVLATPAFASKARLQALGEDVNGSYYVNDNRNIWLNPAAVNNHKDLATFEFGEQTTTADSTRNPRAEGGVFKTMGSMVYGVQLGAASNTANAFRQAAGLNANANEKNNVSLFVGGDAGIKWGAGLDYARSGKDDVAAKNQADASLGGGAGESPFSESMRARLGVQAGDLQAYTILNLISSATDTLGAEYHGRSGYQVGGSYNMMGNVLFAEYQHLGAVGTPADERNSEVDVKTNGYKLGVGRSARLNDKATLFTKASWNYTESFNSNGAHYLDANSCAAATSIFCRQYSSYSVPVVAGVEVDAASWLALRASISQTLWGTEKVHNVSRSLSTSTTVVNAGASLKFGELSVDGVVGNSTGVTNAAGTTTATGQGTLRTDELMTRVSMTYRF